MDSGETTTASVRGNDLTIRYDAKSHRATVSGPAISKSAVDGDPIVYLAELGVYLQGTVEEIRSGKITVDLRAASGIDLRDEDGILRHRPVFPPTKTDPDASPVTVEDSQSRCYTSVPENILDEFLGSEPTKQTVEIRTEVDDGFVLFRFQQSKSDSYKQLKINHRTGSKYDGRVTIPIPICRLLDLDGAMIRWESNETELIGKTTRGITVIDDDPMTRTQTSISWSEGDDSKHATAMIPKSHVDEFGLEAGETVKLSIVGRGDTDSLALCVTKEAKDSRGQSAVIQEFGPRTSSGDRQLGVYIPLAAAKWLFQDSKAESSLSADNSELFLKPE